MQTDGWTNIMKVIVLFMITWTCLKMGTQAQLIFRQLAEVLYLTAIIHLSQGWSYTRGISRILLHWMLWKKLTMPTFYLLKGTSNLVTCSGAQPLPHYPVTISGNVVLPQASISVSMATHECTRAHVHTHTLIHHKWIWKFF